MDTLLESVGLASGELTRLLVLGVVLLVGLILARIALKLTASLFRIGCLSIFLIVAAVFLFNLFG